MTVFELLKGVDCGCGRRHECPIENVVIGKNAFESLPELCRGYEKILLVCDENTYAAAGKNAEAVLGPQVSERIVFPGSSVLIPDERAIEAVKAHTAGKDLLLGAGSGVIQDLCKYVSKETGIPYMIVATAPSMDGYASDGAAMILGGMKVTVKAGLPKAILADTEVLKNAPKEMIRSGFGDIVGKYSALCDWKLSALVTGEYFCPFIYEETYETVRRVRELSGRIFSGDGESIAVLMEALVKVGIMMSFAGTSRPASGSEHHLSHFFEITGIEKKVPYFAHGIDVGYSTVVTQRLREELLTLPAWPSGPVFDRKAWEEGLARVYGSVAPGVIQLQDRLSYHENGFPEPPWEDVKAVLREAPSSEELEEILSGAGFDMKEFTCMYGEEKIRDAVKYGKDLKDRYTVLWLYEYRNG